MSNNIKMDSLFLNRPDTKVNISVASVKNSSFKTAEGKEGNEVDTILNISKGARLRLTNQARKDGAMKKAGVTSAREQFEFDALDTRNHMRGVGSESYPSGALLREWMRIDEPETYAKTLALEEKGAAIYAKNVEELEKKGVFFGEWSEEEYLEKLYTEEVRKYNSEANSVEWDWFNRRCRDLDGWLKNPVTGKCLMVSALEDRYSDAIHDTSVDAYDDSLQEKKAGIWRFNTKFNVLLPIEMLNNLEMMNQMEELSEKEQEELCEKIEKIDTAVWHMKEAEKNYEGSLKYLRFGVKLDHSGNATYYANYTGCRDKNGIAADSAAKLLEKLMSE